MRAKVYGGIIRTLEWFTERHPILGFVLIFNVLPLLLLKAAPPVLDFLADQLNALADSIRHPGPDVADATL
jgi:hypothetical protein